MSPTSHDNSEDVAPENIRHAVLSAAPAAAHLGGGAVLPTGISTTAASSSPPAGGLDMPTAAALPNVAEYLRHMERHQRAYALHTNQTQHSHQRDAASVQALISAHGGAGDNPFLHHMPQLPALAPGAMPHVGEQSFAAAAAAHAPTPGLWPEMLNPALQLTALPPPAAPRVPTAATPAPTDDAVSEAAAAKTAAGSLPFAHAMPMLLTGQSPSAIAARAASLASHPSDAAALSGAPTPTVASLEGVAPTPPSASPAQLPTDAASLSMLYAALSSHFAKVAHTGTGPATGPATGGPAVPRQTPPAAPQATQPLPALPGAGAPDFGAAAMPASMQIGETPANLLAWYHAQHRQSPVAAGYVPACGPHPSDGQIPGQGVRAMGTDTVATVAAASDNLNAHMASVPDNLKRRAESSLRGGCAMSHGMGHPSFFPSHLSANGAALSSDVAMRASNNYAAAMGPRAWKQPRHAASSTACSAAVASLEGFGSTDRQPSLVQNLATACGASSSLRGHDLQRQMSDEEVFSMFADELQQLDERNDPSAMFMAGAAQHLRMPMLDSHNKLDALCQA